MSNCNKKVLNITLCPDIWFTAKNVDDIELFTEIYPFTINKPLEDTNDIDDNNAILTTKPFADNLSTPIDVDIVYFTKVKTDTETFSELKYFITNKILTDTEITLESIRFTLNRILASSQNIEDHNHILTTKPFADNTNTFEDTDYYTFGKNTTDIEDITDNNSIINNKPLTDSNLQLDNSVNYITKYIFYGGYYFENYYFNDLYSAPDYVDDSELYTSGYYFDELYAGSDYIESSGVFITEYIRILNSYIWADVSAIIDNPNINMNKYITEDNSITNIDTGDLYYNEYLDYNYFSGLYAGNFIQNLA